MAYDKDKIFKQSKDVIEANKLVFIEDVVSFLPISKPTFYEFFPIESNELNEIKELLELNKIHLKVKMRNKWFKSESPALQMGLYKLLSTDEEMKKLAMNYSEEKIELKHENKLDVNIIMPEDD